MNHTKESEEINMENKKIALILSNHSIPYYEKDGRIFADTMISGNELFEDVQELTGCSKKALYEFLGY